MFILACLLSWAEARSVKVSFSPEILDKAPRGSLAAKDASLYERAKGVLGWHEVHLDQHLLGSGQHFAHLQVLEAERAHLQDKLMSTGLLLRALGRHKSRQSKVELHDEILAGERSGYQKTLGHLKASLDAKEQAHQEFLAAGERRKGTLKKLSEMAEKDRKFDQVHNHEAALEGVQKELVAARLKHEAQLLQAEKHALDAKTYLDHHEWPLIEVH
jgi:hypothetical protein